MEDLRARGAVQAGYFFGSNSVLNFGKDLEAETAAFSSVTDTDVAMSAFLAAADMHGSYWCDKTLLESPELDLLKGRGWFLGKNLSVYLRDVFLLLLSKDPMKPTPQLFHRSPTLMSPCQHFGIGRHTNVSRCTWHKKRYFTRCTKYGVWSQQWLIWASVICASPYRAICSSPKSCLSAHVKHFASEIM